MGEREGFVGLRVQVGAAGAAAADASKALWAKCECCGHCWVAAYYPMDLMTMSRVLKGCKCPKGCRDKPMLAEQDDGELQEPPSVKACQRCGGRRWLGDAWENEPCPECTDHVPGGGDAQP